MNTHTDKIPGTKSQLPANETSLRTSERSSTVGFFDSRPETIAQRKLIQMADRQASAKQSPIQKKENNSGLPNQLKAGIENLSGYAMDDVKVHYNSNKPAQLHAHAYAQGTDIHLGPGQEKHLPHEAWHVVQQKQGRVKPTFQMKSNILVNDDPRLEHEADVMGAKALNPTINSNFSDQKMIVHRLEPQVESGFQFKTTTRPLQFHGETEGQDQGRDLVQEQELETQPPALEPEFGRRERKAVRLEQRAARTPAEIRRAKAKWKKLRDSLDDMHEKVEGSPLFGEGHHHEDKGIDLVQKIYKLSDILKGKSTTSFGALLANMIGHKDKIGDVRSRRTRQQIEKHLAPFRESSHAFISPYAFARIIKPKGEPMSGQAGDKDVGWGAWGFDANFVTTETKANQYFEEAMAPDGTGLFHLEKKLGIPEYYWVNSCKIESGGQVEYVIYRFIINDPESLHVRLPSGGESQAYGASWFRKRDKKYLDPSNEEQMMEFRRTPNEWTYIPGEWRPLGLTSGGEAEAIIDKLTLAEFLEQWGTAIRVVKDKGLSENTKKELSKREAEKREVARRERQESAPEGIEADESTPRPISN